jgi:hypothetical protein
MSNTKKFEDRIGGPDSARTGCALSSEWVRIVGRTVVYPSLVGTVGYPVLMEPSRPRLPETACADPARSFPE